MVDGSASASVATAGMSWPGSRSATFRHGDRRVERAQQHRRFHQRITPIAVLALWTCHCPSVRITRRRVEGEVTPEVYGKNGSAVHSPCEHGRDTAWIAVEVHLEPRHDSGPRDTGNGLHLGCAAARLRPRRVRRGGAARRRAGAAARGGRDRSGLAADRICAAGRATRPGGRRHRRPSPSATSTSSRPTTRSREAGAWARASRPTATSRSVAARSSTRRRR